MTSFPQTSVIDDQKSSWFHSILLWCFLSFVLPHTAVQARNTTELHVVISGLRSNLGNVHIALYDDPDTFPDPNGMIVSVEVPIYDKIAKHSFTGLKKRVYAIAVYHDENDNNSFDQGFLGIPLEDFAFSNNARAFLRSPNFTDASFILSETKKISIHIQDE